MDTENIKLRTARPEDAARLLEIYAHYVENTAITFEYTVPTLEEFRHRIEHTLERYPYLVIERNGVIQGYAYAGVFKARAAYDWACEMSVYIDRAAEHCGLGGWIYTALEDELRRMGADIRVEDRVAVVGGTETGLRGAAVTAHDLRGGGALCVAALGAEGSTILTGLSHIRRGYASLPEDLRSLGADIALHTDQN